MRAERDRLQEILKMAGKFRSDSEGEDIHLRYLTVVTMVWIWYTIKVHH
jgi:hypothetical protein